MEIGNLNNKNINAKFQKAFDFLLETNLKDLENGRIKIDGENLYANVETYKTKKDGKFEGHRKYTDIQVMISGSEIIKYTDISNCKSSIEYSETKDIGFFEPTNNNIQEIVLNNMDYVILEPNDLHMPQIQNMKMQTVKKIVVKVKN